MMNDSKLEYLTKVEQLTDEETERLLSRMVGKLPRRLEKGKLTQKEALAIQLEFEDEQLQEWRAMMQILKDKEEAKIAAKIKAVKNEKEPEKVKDAKKSKAGSDK